MSNIPNTVDWIAPVSDASGKIITRTLNCKGALKNPQISLLNGSLSPLKDGHHYTEVGRSGRLYDSSLTFHERRDVRGRWIGSRRSQQLVLPVWFLSLEVRQRADSLAHFSLQCPAPLGKEGQCSSLRISFNAVFQCHVRSDRFVIFNILNSQAAAYRNPQSDCVVKRKTI